MSTDRTAFQVLVSIESLLKQLVKQSASAAGGAIAPDSDLLGKYGDPVLRFQPRDWTGQIFKGRRFSQCPPELLDLVASSLDYFADRSEAADERTDRGKPVAPFRRQDAARARGWAKRIREGRHVPSSVAPAAGVPDDWADAPDESEIPF